MEESARPLRDRLRATVAERLSPERTREPTWLERQTVQRLSWDQLTRANRYLELVGKLATGIWVVFMATIVFGVHWDDALEDAVNSGRPVRAAATLVIIIVTLLFVAVHSLTGFARWRLQRELWRRDVGRMEQ